MVHLTGKGMGGRNQEIALGAAEGIAGCRDTCVFSFGSDGYRRSHGCGGRHCGRRLRRAPDRRRAAICTRCSQDNDAYHALKAIDGLIVTGPTGTNVNDLSVVLIKR